MTPADLTLIAKCREWAASPGGLQTLAICADRIEYYGAKAARLNAALAPVEAMTLLPNARGGHSVTIDFPDHDQAARAYALLMQALDA